MSSMLDAFRMKPFDLEPVLTAWPDGPVFLGKPKKDLPVEEWLEKIKEGCVERKVPEEYWYKVAQHFMGPKAQARFDEVKQVIGKVNGGNYRWTWKKFKVAMMNMGWEISSKETTTVKVPTRSWFTRKKTDEPEPIEEAPAKRPPPPTRSNTWLFSNEKAESKEPEKKPPPPTRSNTWLFSKKAATDEPEEIFTAGAAAAASASAATPARPVPKRSKTLAESSFWPQRRNTVTADVEEATKADKGKEKSSKPLPEKPKQQRARSETTVAKRESNEVAKGGEEKDPTAVASAPVWLLNACGALDYLTSEHNQAMTVLSAILITVGSIPAIPAISAGAGGAVLASGAAHAIGALAVGIGQALGASAMKNKGGEGGKQ